MKEINVQEIGENITLAGRLETRPLCIFGLDVIPKNALSINKINRCIANAIFTLAVKKEYSALYINENELNGCCPGGQAWLGYKNFPPMLNYFLSTGSKEYRNGAAEYLIANPTLAESRLKINGKITPLGKNIIFRCCEDIGREEDLNIKSILCFGISEQIRNLSMLAYFSIKNPFDLIQLPMGPSCASFVTYPSAMVENGPKNCVIIGPTDPTENYWFPPNYLSMGIPFEIAQRMSEDFNDSFIMKRPDVAYPKKRVNINK